MSIDTRGRRAARSLLQGAERLGAAPGLPGVRRRVRRRAATRAGLAAVAVVVAGAVVWQGLPLAGRPDPGQPDPGQTVSWPGVPGLDRRVRDAIATGQAASTEVVAGLGAVWVLNRNRLPDQDQLVRVDPTSDRVVARIPVGQNATEVAVGEGSVWVLRTTPEQVDLVQVDPARNQVVHARVLWTSTEPDGTLTQQLVVAGGSAWLIAQHGLVRADLGSGRTRTILPDSRYAPLNGLAAAGDSVWVASAASVLRVRVADDAVLEPTELGDLGVIPIEGLTTGAGELWAFGYGLAVQLDPGTGRVMASFPAGRDPGAATGGVPAFAGDGATVVARDQDTLYLLDPAGGRVRAEVPLPGPGAVAVGAGAVWVTDEDRGRLLRVDPRP